MNQLQMLLSAD
jgi:ferritin-like metal-binding protein YciE